MVVGAAKRRQYLPSVLSRRLLGALLRMCSFLYSPSMASIAPIDTNVSLALKLGSLSPCWRQCDLACCNQPQRGGYFETLVSKLQGCLCAKEKLNSLSFAETRCRRRCTSLLSTLQGGVANALYQQWGPKQRLGRWRS